MVIYLILSKYSPLVWIEFKTVVKMLKTLLVITSWNVYSKTVTDILMSATESLWWPFMRSWAWAKARSHKELSAVSKGGGQVQALLNRLETFLMLEICGPERYHARASKGMVPLISVGLFEAVSINAQRDTSVILPNTTIEKSNAAQRKW